MIAFCSGRSCGVTTGVLALTSQWGERPVVMAECDPAGSSLPSMVPGWDGIPIASGSGVMSIASASRYGISGADVWNHVQVISGNVSVVAGPPGPEQARALGPLWEPVASALGDVPDADVLADCGRVLDADSLVTPVLVEADLVVYMMRADLGGAAQVRADLRRLASATAATGGRLAVVVVDAPGSIRRRAQPREIQDVLATVPGLEETPILGVLAWDWRGAGVLSGTRHTSRWRSTALLRSARKVATAIQEAAGVEPLGPRHRLDETEVTL